MKDHMNLIVISEPELVFDKGSRNSALNDILRFYLQFNRTVTYFSSYNSVLDFNEGGVRYCSLSRYTKSNRFIFREIFSIRKRFRAILKEHDDVHVQFRLPSLYTMQIYFFVKDLIPKRKVSFYIAGDWQESLQFNYPDKLYLSKLLPIFQDNIIKDGVCVFTGNRLLKKNIRKVNRGFSFYSTTHGKADIPLAITDKSQCLAICFIGRMEKLKNFSFFIELAKSEDLVKRYHFHMLGDGPEFASIKKYLDKSNLVNLTMHGHIDDKDQFNDIVARCKYFVLPSYTEGTSKTLPEMMSRSTIPIAFENVGSNNDILKSGNGFLCPVDDLNAVINFINEVDQDKQRYFTFLESGKAYSDEYCIENQLTSMFSFLYSNEDVFSESPSPE